MNTKTQIKKLKKVTTITNMHIILKIQNLLG